MTSKPRVDAAVAVIMHPAMYRTSAETMRGKKRFLAFTVACKLSVGQTLLRSQMPQYFKTMYINIYSHSGDRHAQVYFP